MHPLIIKINQARQQGRSPNSAELTALMEALPRVRCDRDGRGLLPQPAEIAVGAPCTVLAFHGGPHTRRYDNGERRLYNLWGCKIIAVNGRDVTVESPSGVTDIMDMGCVHAQRSVTRDDVELAISVKEWEASPEYPFHLCPSAKALAAQRVGELRAQLATMT